MTPEIGFAALRRTLALTSLAWALVAVAAAPASAEFAFGLQGRVSTMGVDGDPAFEGTRPDVRLRLVPRPLLRGVAGQGLALARA